MIMITDDFYLAVVIPVQIFENNVTLNISKQNEPFAARKELLLGKKEEKKRNKINKS